MGARVLLDKTGEVTEILALIVNAATAAAAKQAREEYDSYLNCWLRSIKTWRRGHGWSSLQTSFGLASFAICPSIRNDAGSRQRERQLGWNTK
jgi:hypothetical protein